MTHSIAKSIAVFTLALASLQCFSKDIPVSSPDRTYSATISVGDAVSIVFRKDGLELMTARNLYISTDNGRIPAAGAKVRKISTRNVDRIIKPVIMEKNGTITDRYNETSIILSDGSTLIIRMYDNGAAYRIISAKEGEITISGESGEFLVDGDSRLIWQTDDKSYNCGETHYVETTVNATAQNSMANLPALVKLPGGSNIVFLESDVQDYPVMWLKKDGESLSTHFWNYPRSLKGDGGKYTDRNVVDVEPFIAKTSGSRAFPWRAFAFASNDSELLSNQLVYLLASECEIEDTSWIKPGWVTFDWWSKLGLYGVDFKSGINTPTAKYMIDFAQHYGIRYFLFDDGWTAESNDLTQTIPGLDMTEVCEYARSKGVDVMLWVTYDMFESQMEKALKQFSEWGIKGIKIDFMDRNDQLISDFYETSAREAAKYHMVVDYHGSCTPNGIRRRFPNVLTREGLVEFEFSGSTDYVSPHYHCLLPFIRGVAGPADYIPCTTRNETKSSFRYTNPPSGQGTRVHSMALSIVIESPMQMLADPQSDYYRENECTEFFTSIPLVWDETRPLKCKIGEYVSLARRNGEEWYVAAITNWSGRDMTIDLGFLPEGNYLMEFFRDGVNADTRAIDYVKSEKTVSSGEILNISLAPGGGWLARITPAP